MADRPVLLIRGSGNERDAQALAALGISSVSESFTQITSGEKETALQLLRFASGNRGWVIVTSRNGVEHWNNLLEPQSLRLFFSKNPALRFAAIGSGSAQALKSLGVAEVLIPIRQSAEGLLDFLSGYPASSAVIPIGNLAGSVLPEGLRRRGWVVHTGVVYVNSPAVLVPAAVTGVGTGEFSAVVLRSPSAARAFAHFLPDSKIPLICGDGSTAATARELALDVAAVADDPSPESIANLVARIMEE